MRLFVALTTAASLGLAACSGASMPIPGNSSVTAPASDASCPKQYLLCVTVSIRKPTKYEVCVSVNGNCTSGSFPTEKWYSKIVTLKGKLYTGIKATIRPNPGNPTHVTLTAKAHLPNSHGNVDFVQDLTACHTKTSCITGKVGIKTV